MSAAVDLLDAIVDRMGGRQRPAQQQLTATISDAIGRRRPLLAHAPTGVGKTLAYLAAALSCRSADDPPILLVTSTIGLQSRLAAVELPLAVRVAEELTGTSVSFAVAKGRRNHLCAAAVADLPDGKTGVADFDQWLHTTDTGDRAEAPTVAESTWASVSTSSTACPKETCPLASSCPAEKARQQRSTAGLIITNAHMHAAHLAAGGRVLPDHGLVIIDEAHAYPEIVCAAAGRQLSTAAILEGVARISNSGAAHTDRCIDAHRRALQLHLLVGDVDGPVVLSSKARAALSALSVACATAVSALSHLKVPTVGLTRHRRHLAWLSATAAAAEDAAEPASPERVAWVQQGTITCGPVDSGPILSHRLHPHHQVIACSATMAVAGSMAPMEARLGLSEGSYDTVAVDSPFDHHRQAVLLVDGGLPSPTEPGWRDAAVSRGVDLLGCADGKSLVLTTSRASMEAFTAAARQQLDGLCVRQQGDAPRQQLLDGLASGDIDVLVATRSYWEGVDVPGLRLVIIDRIPFPSPTDPRVLARRTAAAHPFADVDLLDASVALTQAAGRLIRSTEDCGVLAVLDRRLLYARYAHTLMAGLPPMSATEDVQLARSWLTALAGRTNSSAA